MDLTLVVTQKTGKSAGLVHTLLLLEAKQQVRTI
jgi:hypothetical protein